MYTEAHPAPSEWEDEGMGMHRGAVVSQSAAG